MFLGCRFNFAGSGIATIDLYYCSHILALRVLRRSISNEVNRKIPHARHDYKAQRYSKRTENESTGYSKQIPRKWVNTSKGMFSIAEMSPEAITAELQALFSNSKKKDAWMLMTRVLQQKKANVYHYTVALNASKANLKQAQHLFQNMCDRGILPNEFTYAALLDACAYASDMTSAKVILEDLRLRGFTPNITIFNILLKICQRVNDYEAIGVILRAMRNRGMDPDLYTFNTLVSTYAQAKDIEGIKTILSTMNRQGVKPDLMTYDIALRACKAAGDKLTVNKLLAALQLS